MSRYLELLVAIIVFTFGNFLYAYIVNRDWGRAAERSFFQTVALIAYTLCFP